MRTMRLAIPVVLSVLAFAGCSQPKQAQQEEPPAKLPPDEEAAFLKDIDAAAAGELVKSAQPPVVLDVRTPQEFAAGHIEGAINIDFKGEDFEDEIAKLDKDKSYLLHCRSGGRSGKSKPAFTELGFQAIYHLEGGIIAWEKSGLPVVE